MKAIGDLLNILRAGGGLVLDGRHFQIPDLISMAKAAGEARTRLVLRNAVTVRTADPIAIAKAGKGYVLFEVERNDSGGA